MPLSLSNMYNSHRGMVPTAPNNRLNELLDQVRQEFENQQTRTGEYEQNSTFRIQSLFPSEISHQPLAKNLYESMSLKTLLSSGYLKSLMNFEYLVANQLQEMEMVRQKVYNLEQTQIAMKQR